MSEAPARAASPRGGALKLYLVDGSPSGVSTIELGIFSVRAAVASRTGLPDLIRRERIASYQEAALLLYCGLHNKPVVAKIYASLGTRSAQVKDHAIARVGQTTRYWDGKMADAVVAAWWGTANP